MGARLLLTRTWTLHAAGAVAPSTTTFLPTARRDIRARRAGDAALHRKTTTKPSGDVRTHRHMDARRTSCSTRYHGTCGTDLLSCYLVYHRRRTISTYRDTFAAVTARHFFHSGLPLAATTPVTAHLTCLLPHSAVATVLLAIRRRFLNQPYFAVCSDKQRDDDNARFTLALTGLRAAFGSCSGPYGVWFWQRWGLQFSR